MNIPLGFEMGSGRAVSVPLTHTIVTGQTQRSGKTTTLEALITRSGLRAVAFVTKRGEKSFRLMTEIPPYFRERADWQFVQSLLEATMRQKMDYKEAWIMRASEGAKTLEDVQKNIQAFLYGQKAEKVCSCPTNNKKGICGQHVHPKRCPISPEHEQKWIRKPASGMNADMYYVLNEYFNQVLPELRRLPSTKDLKLRRGINVMDLSAYSFPMQALVIRSVLEYVYNEEKNVVVIIPEAWEFIPEGRRSPVRLAAEELIRKGAVLQNYVWLDSQDTAGIAKVMTRQMQVWIFGVQRDAREINRTIDSIPNFGVRDKTLSSQIATLGVGEFICAYEKSVHRVYVWPAGMEELHAQAIALGQEDAKSWKRIARALDEEKPTTPENFEAGPEWDEFTAGAGDSGSEGQEESGADAQEAPATGIDVGDGDGVERVDVAETEDENLDYKEKFESLKWDYDLLVQSHDALAERVRKMEAAINPNGPAAAAERRISKMFSPTNGHATATAAKEPVDLQLQLDRPVLEVATVEPPELKIITRRRTIEMNGDTTPGRIAFLIHEGFFDSPKLAAHLLQEFKRRGWFGAKTGGGALIKPLEDIHEWGFLVLEDSNYQSVKGMKTSIVEAK